MGLKALLAAQKAMRLHNAGKTKEAMPFYEKALKNGIEDMRTILAYAVLLIRDGQYEKAKELLLSKQKLKMSPDQKTQLFMNYAVCCYKLGDMDKGVGLLERQHQRQPVGMVYQSLGYLYVEKYEPAAKEDFVRREKAKAQRAAEEKAREALEFAGEDAENVPVTVEVPEVDVEKLWQEGRDAAFAFVKEAVEYDDEDAVTLDNLGQFYYRVLGDKESAKPLFEKALEVKEGQIDTLWFLSRYDLDNGDKAAALAKLEKAVEGRFSPLNYATKPMVEAEIERLK